MRFVLTGALKVEAVKITRHIERVTSLWSRWMAASCFVTLVLREWVCLAVSPMTTVPPHRRGSQQRRSQPAVRPWEATGPASPPAPVPTQNCALGTLSQVLCPCENRQNVCHSTATELSVVSRGPWLMSLSPISHFRRSLHWNEGQASQHNRK